MIQAAPASVAVSGWHADEAARLSCETAADYNIKTLHPSNAPSGGAGLNFKPNRRFLTHVASTLMFLDWTGALVSHDVDRA